MIRIRRSPLVLILVLALLGAACGQKPGVHATRVLGASGSDGTVVDGSEGLAVDEQGNPIPGAELDGSGTTGSTGGTTGGGTVGGGTTGGTPTVPGPTKNDRVGVSSKQILVGFHAPLTGAAAVNLDDLQYGNDTYTKWLKSKKVTVHGRNTETIFRDDHYSPSVAVSVCRELVEKVKVFMLVGGAGTDQIQSCARYAYTKGVPYLSAGVTERVVNKLPNYFAFSMSYAAQAKPLANLIKNFDASKHGGQGGKVLVDRCNKDACNPAPRSPGVGAPTETPRVALVYSDTEGFYDARDAFVSAMGGASNVYLKAITKFNISASQANSVVTELKREGIDVVYILTSPTNFGNILTPAEGQNYWPRWVGVGVTMGINLVATTSCGRQRNSFQHAIFFNPWPSVKTPISSQWAGAWRSHGGPDERAKQNPNEHDIAFGLWGGSIVQHILLNAAGADLTRTKFIASAHRLTNAVAPDNTAAGDIIDVYNPLNSRPGDNFGADANHILWANCSGVGIYDFFTRPDGKLLTTADL